MESRLADSMKLFNFDQRDTCGWMLDSGQRRDPTVRGKPIYRKSEKESQKVYKYSIFQDVGLIDTAIEISRDREVTN